MAFWTNRLNKGKDNNMKASLTISSLFVLVLVYIFQASGIEVGEGEIQTTIEVLIKVVSMVGIYVGRIRNGDVNIFGFKK